MPEGRIRVLLVDDHHLVRRGFRRMLEDESDIEVAGEASNGEEAVEKARELKPEVIVMDFALPGLTGAEAARQILKAAPGIGILMLSMHSEPNYVRTCLDAGARGYLLKNAIDLELIDAVRKVAAGQQVMDPPARGGGHFGGAGTDAARTGSAAIDRKWQIESRDRNDLTGERQYCGGTSRQSDADFGYP